MAEASDPSAATAEVSDEIKKLHADFVAEVHKREVSSSENFDKSVLTFSSAGLALSIGYLKDFVPIQLASLPWTLYLSWILFTLATCATMASFLASSRALADQKALAYAYYIERDDTAFARTNRWDRRTTILNCTSGGAFLLAMVLSVVFISINLEKGSRMKQSASQQTQFTVGSTAMQGNQSDILQKGLPVPTMQKVPSAPAQPPSGSGQATPATGSTANPSTK